MSDMAKSIVFAVCMCIVLALLLTTAATALQPRQQQNMEINRKKNVLLAVDLVSRDQRYTAEEITALYNEKIVLFGATQTGAIVEGDRVNDEPVLPIYLYIENGTIQAYIVPIETKGVWGMISGYLAIENDGSTVRGFTITRHSETPGLGGEIERQWFQENFEGKRIIDRHGTFVSVRVARGEVERQVPEEDRPHYVDGISGATLTGKLLSDGLKQVLYRYEPISIRFRDNRIEMPAG